MKSVTAIRMTLLATTLYAGAAHADEGAQVEEATNLCVEMREKIFECKEEFADAFVEHHNPPASERAAMKAKAVEEIVADGSGPLEPRRQVCAEMARKGHRPPADKLGQMKQSLASCAAKSSCQARVACLMPLIRPMVGKGQSVKP